MFNNTNATSTPDINIIKTNTILDIRILNTNTLDKRTSNTTDTTDQINPDRSIFGTKTLDLSIFGISIPSTSTPGTYTLGMTSLSTK